MFLLEILHHAAVISVTRLHGQGETERKEKIKVNDRNTLMQYYIKQTYVWADAGLLVTLHTLYFLLTGPVWVTSTFRPNSYTCRWCIIRAWPYNNYEDSTLISKDVHEGS